MERPLPVYTTFPDAEAAPAMGEAPARLAACIARLAGDALGR